jgi:hypothetical protein
MKCRPCFAFALAIALVLGGCVGAPSVGKETIIITKARDPDDQRPFWKRLLYSIRPDIKFPSLNYIGIKGGARF